MKQWNGNSEKKMEKEELTSTVKKRRSSNFAKRRKSQSLCKIQNKTKLRTVFENLTETRRNTFENYFQTRTTCPFWFGY
jgi:hypothetical protein